MIERDPVLADEAPSHPTTPSEYLRLEMARRGLTAITLAAALGVHPQTLYNILGKDPRKISPRLARAFSQHLGRTVDFWLAERLPLQLVETAAHDLGEGEANPQRGNSDEISTWTSADPPVVQVDWQIRRYLSEPGSGLSIKSYDDRCIRSASVDLAINYIIPDSYDRGLRDKWTLASRKLIGAAPDEMSQILKEVNFQVEYWLDPGQSVIVMSLEDFTFGDYFLARAGQNTGTLLSGLQVLHGLQVDPGYSGPLFMRMLNVTDQRQRICQGGRLASVEIYRLAVKPEEKYQENAESRVARLSEKVFSAVSGMFRYAEKDMIIYKATFLGALDWTYASDEGDVKEKAVDWIREVLANPSAHDYNQVEEEVVQALDAILISRDDAEALHQHFSVPKQIFDTVVQHFAGGRKQTLADTIARLGRRLGEIATYLLDDAIEGRHS